MSLDRLDERITMLPENIALWGYNAEQQAVISVDFVRVNPAIQMCWLNL